MARILCIEDDGAMVNLVEIIVSKMGHEVKGAQNGREGLALVKSFRPDMILLDLMMPDIDGWEVYQQLKANEETQHIPVIVVSARAHQTDKLIALRLAHVDDYITKPFTPEKLRDSIKNVLAERSLL
ncbi:MAG: response regulator [Anaerolineae bacterium]|nr:response regulator [Anaerolineae bacterium]